MLFLLIIDGKEEKDMRRISKKAQLIYELKDRILSYADMIFEYGMAFQALDKKMNVDLEVARTVKGSQPAKNLCNDIIDVYNSKNEKEYKNIYAGSFRSSDIRKRKEYQERLQKDFVRAIQSKYDCGINLGGLSFEDIIEGFKLFAEQLR